METTDKERKVLVSSKVPPELEERLKKVAKEKKRTVSNLIFILLDEHPELQEEPETVAA